MAVFLSGIKGDSLFDRWTELRRQYAQVSVSLSRAKELSGRQQEPGLGFSGPQPGPGQGSPGPDPKALEDSLRRLEGEINIAWNALASRYSELFNPKPIPLSELRKRIGKGEALVQYSYFGDTLWAWVVEGGGLKLWNLCPGAKADSLVEAFRDEMDRMFWVFGHPDNRHKLSLRSAEAADTVEASLRRLWPISQELYTLLLGKVFGNRPPTRLNIIPDGILNTLPFEALVVGDSFLLYRSEILYHSSPATAGRLGRINTSDTLMAWAPVSYSDTLMASRVSGTFTSTGFASGAMKTFPELRSADTSVRVVSGIWRGPCESFLRRSANEAEFKRRFAKGRLKKAAGLSLYLSTHGFYWKDLPNPLIASGIAFYGANAGASGPGSEDGILTAMELLGLDLSGVDLLYLSACETGLGEASSGEGIFGLRRAISVSGASSEVITLWPVHESIGLWESQAFFRALAGGNNPCSAMAQSKKELIQAIGTGLSGTLAPLPPHPFFWAGWTVGR
jgi:CHAT domain-containing protein